MKRIDVWLVGLLVCVLLGTGCNRTSTVSDSGKSAPVQKRVRLVVRSDNTPSEHGSACFPDETSIVSISNVKLGDRFTFEYLKRLVRNGTPVYAFNIQYNIEGKSGGMADEVKHSELPKRVLKVDEWNVWIEEVDK